MDYRKKEKNRLVWPVDRTKGVSAIIGQGNERGEGE